jgi:outer membrane protein OmpA-like peptidoglycan-associated protein
MKSMTTLILQRVLICLIVSVVTVALGSAAEETGTAQNLKMQVLDLVFKVEDLADKVQDLQLKETDTEIRIELAADVLFDFDKASLRPQAQQALFSS